MNSTATARRWFLLFATVIPSVILSGCQVESMRDECALRFAKARTAADTLAVLDHPQGPRGIYCGAFLKGKKTP